MHETAVTTNFLSALSLPTFNKVSSFRVSHMAIFPNPYLVAVTLPQLANAPQVSSRWREQCAPHSIQLTPPPLLKRLLLPGRKQQSKITISVTPLWLHSKYSTPPCRPSSGTGAEEGNKERVLWREEAVCADRGLTYTHFLFAHVVFIYLSTFPSIVISR